MRTNNLDLLRDQRENQQEVLRKYYLMAQINNLAAQNVP